MEAAALLSNASGPRGNGSGGGGGGGAAAGPGGEPASPGPARWGWSGAALASQALLLLLIFALSALGNGAVVAVIARHRQLRTVTNAFVLSLALAELLAAVLCLPPAFLSLLGGRPPGAWLFGPRLCRAGATAHAGLGAAATLTMALLAFDRYCAIVRQPRRKMGRRRAAQLLAAVWLAALGFSGPWYLLARPEGEEEAAAEAAGARGAPATTGGPPAAPPGSAAPVAARHCLYALPWGSSPLGPPYAAALIVLCYLLPFALMCFCHYHICRAVRLSESRVRPLTAYGHLLRFYGEVRTATTVLIMIVSIICCWGPYCVLGLAAAAGRLSSSPTLDAVASWMAWANGAVNPLIYAARNPDISLLLGRGREGGYRTRNAGVGAYLAAARGRRAEARGRAERYASRGGAAAVGGALAAPGLAGGEESATWACKNPAVLFCRDGGPGAAAGVWLQPKLDSLDTSL